MASYVDRAANINVAASITKDSANTSNTDGTGVDTEGFDSVVGVIDTGTITDGTHTFKLQHSDTDGSYADVPADEFEAYNGDLAIVAADDDEFRYVAYQGQKRYVRWKLTVSGSPGTGGIYRAFFVLQDPHEAPVNS